MKQGYSYQDYYGELLKLKNQVLFADNNVLRKGTIRGMNGSVFIVECDNGKCYEFSLWDSIERVIKFKQS